MTAGIYAKRAGKSVLLIEKMAQGGQILATDKIENYPAFSKITGNELASKIWEQAKNLGVELKLAEMKSLKKLENHTFEISTDEGVFLGKTVIIATGTDYRKLGLIEEAELTGKGISYCATCDGSLYQDKEIAVVGGGNSAFYSALYLANLAKKVYLIHRREGFRADTAIAEQARRNDKIEFLLGREVIELESNEGKLSGIKLKKNNAGNGAEKLNSETVLQGKEENLEISALFVLIGRKPKNDFLEGLVDLSEDGYIVTDENGRTNCAGIYAAGDCRQKELRQIITAAADGATAASSAVEGLNKLTDMV